MSVFTKLRSARKAAKGYKPKDLDKSNQVDKDNPATDIKIPYKHVPKHAAIDALNGAPSSWQFEDKVNIKKAHARRTQLNSRTNSERSTQDWGEMNGLYSQSPSLYRNPSFRSKDPAWSDRGDNSYLNKHAVKCSVLPPGLSMADSGFASGSPLNSYMNSYDVSPAESSFSSTTSEKERSVYQPPQLAAFSQREMLKRLHANKARKIGEAPLFDLPRFIGPESALVERSRIFQRRV